VQSLLGEQCENATHDKSLSYQCSNCHFVSLTCGDETTDPGEECDEGKKNSSSPDAVCRPNCSLSRCGDSVIDSVELCDDGNRLNGDGCDRYCLI
jgi:cysteine-rich repeat protein